MKWLFISQFKQHYALLATEWLPSGDCLGQVKNFMKAVESSYKKN